MPTTITALVLHPVRDDVLARQDGGVRRLPAARLDRRHWHADHAPLAEALASEIGHPVRLVRRLAEGTEAHPSGEKELEERRLVMLAELEGAARDPAPEGWAWIALDDAAEVGEPWERVGVARLAGDLALGAVPALRPPWNVERSGWWRELRGWMEAELARAGRVPVGEPRPVKVWSLSGVYRQETDRGPVYLKVAADAPPLFVDEARLTAELARRFPDCIPRVLAARPGPGWLLLEGEGDPIRDDKELTEPERRRLSLLVARRHAELQVASAGFLDALLAAGCIDRRVSTLAAEVTQIMVDPLVQAALEPADWARLRAGEGEIRAAIARMAELAIPAALVHGDLHLGNALLRGGEPVIIDWADACIAPPMVDLIAPLWAKDRDMAAEWKAIYLAVWEVLVPREKLEEAWTINGILLPLHHVISYRSLARHVEPVEGEDTAGGLGQFAPALARAVGAGPA